MAAPAEAAATGATRPFSPDWLLVSADSDESPCPSESAALSSELRCDEDWSSVLESPCLELLLLDSSDFLEDDEEPSAASFSELWEPLLLELAADAPDTDALACEPDGPEWDPLDDPEPDPLDDSECEPEGLPDGWSDDPECVLSTAEVEELELVVSDEVSPDEWRCLFEELLDSDELAVSLELVELLVLELDELAFALLEFLESLELVEADFDFDAEDELVVADSPEDELSDGSDALDPSALSASEVVLVSSICPLASESSEVPAVPSCATGTRESTTLHASPSSLESTSESIRESARALPL